MGFKLLLYLLRQVASSPCFAGLLAMTLLLKFLVELYTIHSNMHRHCEEPRDEAICLNNNKRNYRIIIIEPTPPGRGFLRFTLRRAP